MESLQTTVTNLTGAVNALLEQVGSMERRISALDSLRSRLTLQESGRSEGGVREPEVEPRAPATEADLRDISRLPDSVKELQAFDGNPVQYVSWVHSVESILNDFKVVRNKPIYRAILQHIRQKVRGTADAALISYNIFDTNWTAIKECLSLHYADKRDIRTLEYQLHQLSQKDSRLDEFYAAVNHQFSLIINKIKTESYSEETTKVLIDTYRNRALDVFIRGLNGELAKMLLIQRPKTLPEAYSACLEIQNTNFRNFTIHSARSNNRIVAPVNTIPSRSHGFKADRTPPIPPRTTWRPQDRRTHFDKHDRQVAPKRDQPSTSQPPVEKMDVDQSVQSKRVNYINRPNPFKRSAKSDNFPRKQQRLYHVTTDAVEEEDDGCAAVEEEDFLSSGHLAYHT